MQDDLNFFSKEEVFDGLSALEKSDSLVLYCGAGVTFDLTGLGWSNLVKEILNSALQNPPSNLAKSVQYLISSGSLEDKQKASLVTAFMEDDGIPFSSTEFIEILQDTLYKKHGWERGKLLEDIVGLAISLAIKGKTVEIITTNYDVYIIDAFKEGIKGRTSLGVETLPEIFLKDFKTGDRESIISAPTKIGEVDIVYLHGRIDRPGECLPLADRDIVFSELSYAETREQTTGYLIQKLSNSSFLCLGASLTDDPLINALAVTREYRKIHERIALLTLSRALSGNSSNGIVDSSIHEALSLRGNNIGIKVLKPPNFGHIAQFVEELHSLSDYRFFTGGNGDSKRWFEETNLQKRVCDWFKDWSNTQKHQDADLNNFHLLKDAKDEACDFLYKELRIPKRDNEFFKIEIWALEPATDVNDNLLVNIANSVGPILDHNCHRKEPIERFSNVASVRAFSEGKPSLIDLSDLGIQNGASRWNSFFCVPLFDTRLYEIEGESSEVTIPMRSLIGCITLASTLPVKEKENIKMNSFSVLTDKKLDRSNLMKLVHFLSEIGKEILKVPNNRFRLNNI